MNARSSVSPPAPAPERPPVTSARRHRWRRGAGWTALVLGVLVLIVYGLGGWYFAGQIRSDGLAVTHTPPGYEDLVVAVDADTVTVRAHDEGQDQPGEVVGLWWSGGYAQLGPATSTAGTDQVRPVRAVLWGTLPGVGTSVELDGFAVRPDPSALKLPFSEVQIATPLGEAPAWLVPGASDTWAVVAHGRGAERAEALRVIPTLHRAGLTVLDITYRNDEGAPQTDGLARFGQEEWPDLQAAVVYAVDHGADGVVLYGLSMGGGMDLAYLLHGTAGLDAVRGVVLDAPTADFGATIEQAADERTLPLLGLPIPDSLVTVAKWIESTRDDVSWSQVDYVAQAGDLPEIPILILHGADDARIYPATSRALAAARPDLVTLVEFPDAGHVLSWNADPGRYEAEVTAFLATLSP
jgi:hypothetical protein